MRPLHNFSDLQQDEGAVSAAWESVIGRLTAKIQRAPSSTP